VEWNMEWTMEFTFFIAIPNSTVSYLLTNLLIASSALYSLLACIRAASSLLEVVGVKGYMCIY